MMNMLDSDSDWESYSDTSASDDHNSIESLFGDHAQSILSSLDSSIRKIDDFLALDRGFVHGDYVSSITDPSGQIGRVVDVNLTVDLESGYGETVKGVDSKKILRLRSFYVGDHVIYGPWVGRVDRVLDLVTVLFDDGSKCQIYTGDPENLLPLSSSLLEDAPYPYYPGQRVRMRRSTLLKSARWLCGTWKGSQEEGIICHTEIGSVHVNWIASVMVGCNIISAAPPPLQDPKDLTLLSCYPHASWQLGDWCKLPLDYFQNLQMPKQEQVSPSVAPQCVAKMQEFGRKHHAREPVYVIAKTRAKVDILWQDGSHSVGVDPCTLLPVNSVGDHDFWPEQVVLQKATSDDAHGSSSQRLGIVRYVDAQERTVKIQWALPDLKRFDDSHREFDEETVSAYELVEHPDFNYCLGDVVFRYLFQFEHLEETLAATQADGPGPMHEIFPVNRKLSLEVHDNYVSHHLSYIGNVIGFKDGGIEVKWANGLVSKVNPSEIFGLDRFDTIAATPVHGNEVAEENVGKESEHDRQLWHEKEVDQPENYMNDSGEDCKMVKWHARALFFPQAAVGFLANVATILFGYHGSTSLPGTKISGYFNDLNKSCNLNLEKPVSQEVTEESECQIMHTEDLILHNEKLKKTSLENQVAVGMHEPLAASVGSTKTEEFKQFGIVDDYSDHHFIDGISKGLGLSQAKRGWLKKVQQEWGILEKNLPDTIYVRVYEERMDLMRASIVGAPGTPYHDALFFFDICFPSDYPHEPPLVYYNSGGLRLNPNLYESGKVCLSLLKTWTGTENEVWNPEKSSILQVLLSLQALVLNEKPYFNEAGYDKQIGRADGERNSITYNENSFLLSCKSMLYLLRKPPKNFEQFVVDHFTHRSHRILLACKAYMDGAQVGCAFENEQEVTERHKNSSTGFKIMLAKLFPMLVSRFSEIGIDCSQFLDCAKQTGELGKETC